MAVWAALYYSAKAPGLGSIWISNIQWSRQCLKYTGWMGLPSDHRGSTVHYLLKLPINCPSHSLSLSVSPSLTLHCLKWPLSACLSLSPTVCISFYLPLSVCLHLSLWISHSDSGLFFISPFCLSQLSGALSALVSAFISHSCATSAHDLSLCLFYCLYFSVPCSLTLWCSSRLIFLSFYICVCVSITVHKLLFYYSLLLFY